MSRKLSLLIWPFLLVPLFINSSLGIATKNTTLPSFGTILYPSPNVRLMGVDGPEWINFDEEQADLLKNSGANTIRWPIYADEWAANEPAWTEPDNPLMVFQTRLKQIAEMLKQRGIRLIISGYGYYDRPLGWAQLKADVIMNADGKGDKWIADYGDVIAKLQPYGINVMNEPEAVDETTYAGTMTKEQFFEAYRQFVIRAVTAWRTIKPDLVAIVSGCPFWDLKPIAANPIPLLNVVYGFHYHYCHDDTLSNEPADIAYWDATDAQTLAQAKAILYDQWLNPQTWGPGLQNMLDAGLELCFIEVGAGNQANNAEVWMQDVYDFCKARNIGVLQHQFRPYPRYPAGILQEGSLEQPSGIWWKPVTLNSMGELWSRNMQG